MIVVPGTTSFSVDVQLLDDDGLPLTGKVAADFPPVYYSVGTNTASVAITLSDLAAITSAYSSGGVKERLGSAGYYRLDLPNAAIATDGTRTRVYGEGTNKHVLCEPIQVAKVVATLSSADVSGNLPAQLANTTHTITRLVIANNTASPALSITNSGGGGALITGADFYGLSIDGGSGIGVDVAGYPNGMYIRAADDGNSAVLLNSSTSADPAVNTVTGVGVALIGSAMSLTSGERTSVGTAVWATTTRQLTGTQTFSLTGDITGNLSGSVGTVAGNVTGSVASVTGAVGSVTGNVGGNVVGSVGSLATQAKADVNAEADAALADVGVTTTVTGRIDAAVSSRGTSTLTTGDIPTATAIASQVNTTMTAAHGAGSWQTGSGGGGGGGSGAYTVTVTVTDANDAAVQNALVRYTEGLNTFTGTTDVSGEATFNLDAATYTVAITKAGYSFAGTTHAVSGDDTAAYELAAIVIPAASNPAQTNAYTYTRDAAGTILGGQTVHIRRIESGDNDAHMATLDTVSDDITGLVLVALEKSTRYEAWIGSGKRERFTTGTGSTYELPALLANKDDAAE